MKNFAVHREVAKLSLILAVTSALALILGNSLASSSSTIQSSNQNSSVTVVYEGNYPWLQQGAFANYTSLNIGPPYFVTTTGQLLLAPEGPPGSQQGGASLNWSVASRAGNMVTLNVYFHATGCQDNETAYHIDNQSVMPCTYYDYSNRISVNVNLTNNEAYVGGIDQGILNFWETPLLQNTTVLSGSVIVNGTMFPSYANVSSVEPSTETAWQVSGPPYVNVSGSLYKNTFPTYAMTPTTFGENNANWTIGWIHGSSSNYVGNKLILLNPLGPGGTYDYYNGLAYQFSIPQYPINETICRDDQPLSDCSIQNVSTPLGTYTRSGESWLQLISTNIQLGSNQVTSYTTNQQQQSSTAAVTTTTTNQTNSLKKQGNSLLNSYQILEIAIPVIAVVSLSGFFGLRSRRR
jgi:hypothetical protein